MARRRLANTTTALLPATLATLPYASSVESVEYKQVTLPLFPGNTTMFKYTVSGSEAVIPLSMNYIVATDAVVATRLPSLLFSDSSGLPVAQMFSPTTFNTGQNPQITFSQMVGNASGFDATGQGGMTIEIPPIVCLPQWTINAKLLGLSVGDVVLGALFVFLSFPTDQTSFSGSVTDTSAPGQISPLLITNNG